MPTLDYQQLALIAESRRLAVAGDPIKDHRFSSAQAREMFVTVCEGIEAALRSGNVAAKTTEAAFLFVCLARGVREVDGRTRRESTPGHPEYVEPWHITLPAIVTPNVGLLIVESYKQAEESSIAAYRRWLGDWPSKFVKNSEGTSEIRVKPNRSGSDNPDTWSKILVFPRTGTIPKGIRAHWAHADEPPTQAIWNEVRNRIIAGQPLYRAITFTPMKAEEWYWLREDYAVPTAWKREILLSVFDNQFLPRWQLEQQKEKAAINPLEMAVLYGAYVNLAGSNPWAKQGRLLQGWLDKCRDSARVEVVSMPMEVLADDGLQFEEGFGEVHIWEEPIPGERYYVIGDASLGQDPKEHDPCGAMVVRRGFRSERPAEVALYVGYCGAYALGVGIMAPLAERYNDGLCDPDVTGGYGRPTLRGLKDYASKRHPNGYPHINRERRIESSGGGYSLHLGTTVTASLKADMIEAIRHALLTDAIEVPSASTVRELMEAVMDLNGKLLKPPGVHYERFHCLARACQLILDRNQTESGTRREHEIADAFKREGIKLPNLRQREGRLGQFQWVRS